MEKEVYEFKVILQSKVKVGDTIYAPNGRKGKVISIDQVNLTLGGVKIKGKAELEPVEETERRIN